MHQKSPAPGRKLYPPTFVVCGQNSTPTSPAQPLPGGRLEGGTLQHHRPPLPSVNFLGVCVCYACTITERWDVQFTLAAFYKLKNSNIYIKVSSFFQTHETTKLGRDAREWFFPVTGTASQRCFENKEHFIQLTYSEERAGR